MLDREGANNFFNQINQLWVNPEIESRKGKGILPDSFSINKCLITFPNDKAPIVKFNDEFGWEATARKVPGKSFKKGQAIYIYDISSIEKVKLPTIDGKRVAFIFFIVCELDAFKIIFDFSPNHPNFDPKNDEPIEREIAGLLQERLVEQSVNYQESMQSQLSKIGLWTVPALLPHPLCSMVLKLEKNNITDAKLLLLKECTPNFFAQISSEWWKVKEIEIRRKLIEDALTAHKEGKYTLSISALLPQIEGIITDWIYSQTPENIPREIKPRSKKFKELVLRKPTLSSYKRIVNSTINFILSGPVFSPFKIQQGVNDIETAFPNRNVVAHGRFDNSLFTEENSLKLLLLIDTLYYVISKQTS
jgi:hypothetical protein